MDDNIDLEAVVSMATHTSDYLSRASSVEVAARKIELSSAISLKRIADALEKIEAHLRRRK